MSDTLLFRPLHLAEQLTDELGTSITYAYDDLVFPEHSDVLLQFDGTDSTLLYLYINGEAGKDEAESLRDRWLQAARTKDIALHYNGTFAIEQLPGKEEVTIRFN